VEVTSGVIVTEVVQGSQADDRGIVPGDIITTINNKPITSLRDFNVAIKSVTPGKELWVDGKFKDGRKSKMLRAPSQ
jgi:S1-C subfamily serine protease